MFRTIDTLADKAKLQITELFVILGDAGTPERSHKLDCPKAPAVNHTGPSSSTAQTKSAATDK